MSKEPPVHPVADFYPAMSDEDLAGLAADIKAHGQRVPILMTDGAILDGRHRWKACVLAEVEPLTIEWDKKGDPVEVARSLNNKRRHSTPGQRAAIAAAEATYYEAQSLAKRADNFKGAPKGDESTPLEKPPKKRNESERSTAKAAKKQGAGVGATKAAKKIKEKAPDVFEALRDGKVTVAEAKRAADLPAAERAAVVEQARAGKKPKATKKPAPPVAAVEGWDQSDAICRVRDWLKEEALRWPKEYRPVLAQHVRSMAKTIEVI